MQLIIAIAALCSVPTFQKLTESEVLDCQKYYVKCMKDSLNSSADLMNCIEKKKRLGGGE